MNTVYALLPRKPHDQSLQGVCKVSTFQLKQGVMADFIDETGADVPMSDSRVQRYLSEHDEVRQYKAGWQALGGDRPCDDRLKANRQGLIDICTMPHIQAISWFQVDYWSASDIKFLLYVTSSAKSHIQVVFLDFLDQHNYESLIEYTRRMGLEEYHRPAVVNGEVVLPPYEYYEGGRECVGYTVGFQHNQPLTTDMKQVEKHFHGGNAPV